MGYHYFGPFRPRFSGKYFRFVTIFAENARHFLPVLQAISTNPHQADTRLSPWVFATSPFRFCELKVSWDHSLVNRPRLWYNRENSRSRQGGRPGCRRGKSRKTPGISPPGGFQRGSSVKLLKKHLNWFLTRVDQDRLDSTAAHGAFFLLISFLPFVALLLTLMQQIHFSDGVSLIEAALRIFPDSVAQYLATLLPDPIHSSGVVPVAVIAAVWSSSMGMLAVIKGLDQIFQVKETRGYIHLRVIAVIYVLIFAAVLIVAAALLVFGTTIYRFLLEHSSAFVANILINFKSLAGFVMLFLFFTLLYTGVPRRRAKFLHNLAGAAFSAAGWVLFSYFFSIFVENFSDFSIYGSLATLVILMFWLFFCMYIMFLGAEVSMWLETSGIGMDLHNLRKKEKKHRQRRKRERAQRRAQHSSQKKE